MSVVTVQLGQCGNQVGYELFDAISGDAHRGHRKEFSATSCERFFHQTARGGELPGYLVTWSAGHHTPVHLRTRFLSPDLVARAVLVDMEPKVIKQSISRANRSGRWRYGDASSFCQKQGSGNNWANGWETKEFANLSCFSNLIQKKKDRILKVSTLKWVNKSDQSNKSGLNSFISVDCGSEEVLWLA